VWAAAIETSRDVAAETEQLEANRKTLAYEFPVYALPALAQAAVGSSRPIYVIQR
jgi:hypothetical protein